jgi:triacylglycerol lipase
VITLPGDGTGDLTMQADVLDEAVQAALRGGAPSVDLVGYSAGGVVARLWVADRDGARKARRVITLGSPHHGARLAGLGAVFAPESCPPACRQLAPGSPLLARLDATAASDRPGWLSVWTVQDEVVTPPESAQLPGAINVAVQAVCPGTEVSHAGLPTNPLVTAVILRALSPAPLAPPGPADCRLLRGGG